MNVLNFLRILLKKEIDNLYTLQDSFDSLMTANNTRTLDTRTLEDQNEGLERIKELVNNPFTQLSEQVQTKLNNIYQNITNNELAQYQQAFNRKLRNLKSELIEFSENLRRDVAQYSQRTEDLEHVTIQLSIPKLIGLRKRIKELRQIKDQASQSTHFKSQLLSELYSLKLIHAFACGETHIKDDYHTSGASETSIHYAASYRMPNTVDLLLQLGANPNHQINPGKNESYTPLDIALNSARPHNTESEFQATIEVIRKLAEHNALHSADGKAPVRGINYRALHHLAEKEEWDIVKRIIQLTDNENYLAHILSVNTNPVVGNQKFDTLFHIAARQDNFDAANFLLSIARGIDSQTMHEFCDSHFLAIENGDGETPLSIAQQSNSEVTPLFNGFISEYTASQDNTNTGFTLSNNRYSATSATYSNNPATPKPNEDNLETDGANSKPNTNRTQVEHK